MKSAFGNIENIMKVMNVLKFNTSFWKFGVVNTEKKKKKSII